MTQQATNLNTAVHAWRRSLLVAMPFASVAFLIGIPLNTLSQQQTAFDQITFPLMAVGLVLLNLTLICFRHATNLVLLTIIVACPIFFLAKLSYILFASPPGLDIPAEMTEGFFWIPATYLLGLFTTNRYGTHRMPRLFVIAVLALSLAYALNGVAHHSPNWSAIFALVELNLANIVLLTLSQSFLGTKEHFTRATAQAEAMRQLAHADPLTGLHNRLGMQTALEHMVQVKHLEQPVGVVFLDLDGFKAINDTLGHNIGDEVLCEVAKRWQGFCRAHDLLGRWNGDEFVMLLGNTNGPNATHIAHRLIAALEQPITLGDHTVQLSASAGVSSSPEDASTAHELLRHADSALHAVKRNGKNGVRKFSQDLDGAFEEHQQLERDLRKALEQHQFELAFQPIVHLETAAVFKVETLLRWRHPERGMVSPATFIPLAESSGFIVPLGEWILQTACFEAARWNQQGRGQAVRVAVNTSALQLAQPNFIGTVTLALARSGLPAHLLELEITEGVVLHNVTQVQETLHKLRELGISLAIDDFGTGYSSLRYLRDLPVSTIKVDRSFVNDLGQPRHESPFAFALFDAILSIARTLNLEVIAEGIETEAQLETLRGLGCTGGQGYYFARPEPAERIFERLSTTPKHQRVGSSATLN